MNTTNLEKVVIEEDDATYVSSVNGNFYIDKNTDDYICLPYHPEGDGKIGIENEFESLFPLEHTPLACDYIEISNDLRIYICWKGGKIVRVVHTATSWSDDRNVYEIENDFVKNSINTEHGVNRRYVSYAKDNDGIYRCVSVVNKGRKFGTEPHIGEKSPLFTWFKIKRE